MLSNDKLDTHKKKYVIYIYIKRSKKASTFKGAFSKGLLYIYIPSFLLVVYLLGFFIIAHVPQDLFLALLMKQATDNEHPVLLLLLVTQLCSRPGASTHKSLLSKSPVADTSCLDAKGLTGQPAE